MTRPLFVEGDRVTLRVADDTEPALERGKNHPDVRRYVSVFRRPQRSDSSDSPDGDDDPWTVDACAHMIDYGFRELALHRVSATAMAPNGPSIRMLDRLGFVHEGTAREAQFADGEYVDVERYGLLRDEWESPEAVLDADSHPSGIGE